MKSTLARSIVILSALLGLWTLSLLIVPYSAPLGLLLKIALWGLPAYLFPKLVDRVNPNDFLRLNRAPQGKWIYLSAAFLVPYSFLINGGKIEINSVSAFYILSAVVVSPVVEEIAFRGVVLQKLDQRTSFKFSNSLTTIAFVLYHLPLWSARGQSASVMACVWVAFFSLWMGYFMRKSKSLWTCILVHAMQNLIFGLL